MVGGMAEKIIECRCRERPVEQRGQEVGDSPQVENVVADRDAGSRIRASWRENAERQVLDRKVGMFLGTFDPAGAGRIMRLINHRDHRTFALGKPAQTAS